VRANGRGTLSIGAPTVLTIRPEKLLFGEARASERGPGVNRLSTVVREVTFVGEMRRYALETALGASIILKQQHRFGVRTPQPSERVVIEWSIEDTLIV